jgi:hypothetical protein
MKGNNCGTRLNKGYREGGKEEGRGGQGVVVGRGGVRCACDDVDGGKEQIRKLSTGREVQI